MLPLLVPFCVSWMMALGCSAIIAGRIASERGEPGSRKNKIVVFKRGTMVSADTYERLIREKGGRLIKALPYVNSVVCQLPEACVESLSQHPDVECVEDDAEVFALCRWVFKPHKESQPPQQLPWGITRIKAPDGWQYVTGKGVNVGVIDTGIDLEHPDLAANVKGGINIIDDQALPRDDNGHGTHVAGIISAINNEIGVVGVAPEANLYAVKVLDSSGRGVVSDVIQGVEWCALNGMDVVNMSLGISQDSVSLGRALDNAIESGVIIVASAGNAGKDDSVLFPARHPGVIAVSATNSNDELSSFSSRGKEVSIAAPGENIPSTFKGKSYEVLSGTSMAAPHVTGTIALILSAITTISADKVKKVLFKGAEKLPNLGPDEQGSGLVNVVGALMSLQR